MCVHGCVCGCVLKSHIGPRDPFGSKATTQMGESPSPLLVRPPPVPPKLDSGALAFIDAPKDEGVHRAMAFLKL